LRKLNSEAQNPVGGSIGNFLGLVQTNLEPKDSIFPPKLPILNHRKVSI
jgi:hypothetical protein